MKRILTAIIGGAITFSVVYGLAASLNLTTDSLGSGTTTVASCQASGPERNVHVDLFGRGARIHGRHRHDHRPCRDLLQQGVQGHPVGRVLCVARGGDGHNAGVGNEHHGHVLPGRLGGGDHRRQRGHQRLARRGIRAAASARILAVTAPCAARLGALAALTIASAVVGAADIARSVHRARSARRRSPRWRCTTAGLSVVQTSPARALSSVSVGVMPAACGGATLRVGGPQRRHLEPGQRDHPGGGGTVTVTLAVAVAVTLAEQTDVVVSGP